MNESLSVKYTHSDIKEIRPAGDWCREWLIIFKDFNRFRVNRDLAVKINKKWKQVQDGCIN